MSAVRRSGPAARGLAVAGALAALLAAQALVQRGFDERYPQQRFEKLLYVPTGAYLEVLSLGFRPLLADLMWMKAIGYFGTHSLTDRSYPWLYHILDQVTALDPAFRYPYYFGGIVLTVEAEAAESSIRLLRKGMRQYPGDWRFPFYTGFAYFYHLHDAERAAVFMNLAATLPGAPEYLPRLAASLMARAGRLEAAVRFLETVAEGTRDEWVRRRIEDKIRSLREGRVPAALEDFLAGKPAP